MRRTTALTLLAALTALAFLAGWSVAFQDPAAQEGAPLVRVMQEREPYWDTLSIKNDTPTRILKVRDGYRFVLTDMWLLSMEDRYTPPDVRDRVWLENRREGNNYIVFDSQVAELDLPLRWNTGVAFQEGTEVWMEWRFNSELYGLRRVHLTGYWEALPAPAGAR